MKTLYNSNLGIRHFVHLSILLFGMICQLSGQVTFTIGETEIDPTKELNTCVNTDIKVDVVYTGTETLEVASDMSATSNFIWNVGNGTFTFTPVEAETNGLFNFLFFEDYDGLAGYIEGSDSLLATLKINVNPEIEIFSTVKNASCNGYNDGSITLDVSGGLGPSSYDYKWSNIGSPNSPINPDLIAGNYTVTISSGNCVTVSNPFTINEPLELTYTTTHFDESCDSVSDGKIIFNNVGGGNGEYQYYLNETSYNSPEIGGLQDKDYTLRVVDSNGCESLPGFEQIDKGTTIDVDVNFIGTIQMACENGQTITLVDESTADPSSSILSNKWTINMAEEINNLSDISFGNMSSNGFAASGIYNISLEVNATANENSELGIDGVCTDILTDINVEIYEKPESQLSFIENSGLANNDGILCDGDNVNLNPNGSQGSTPYSYLYTTPNGEEFSSSGIWEFESEDINHDGTFKVIVTDNNGCTDESQIEGVVNLNPIANISGDIVDFESFTVDNRYYLSGSTSDIGEPSTILEKYLWEFDNPSVEVHLSQDNNADLELSPYEDEDIYLTSLVGGISINSCLKVTDSNMCHGIDKEDIFVKSSTCTIIASGFENVCQGKDLEGTFKFSGSAVGSGQTLSEGSHVSLIDLDSPIPPIWNTSAAGWENGQIIATKIEGLPPGDYQFFAELVLGTNDSCNTKTAIEISNVIKVFDKIDIEGIDIQAVGSEGLSPNSFCSESPLNFIISGINSEVNSLILSYEIGEIGNENPPTVEIPIINDSFNIKINVELPEDVLRKDYRIKFISIYDVNDGDLKLCQNEINQVFEYSIEDCTCNPLFDDGMNQIEWEGPAFLGFENEDDLGICDGEAVSIVFSSPYTNTVFRNILTTTNVDEPSIKDSILASLEKIEFSTNEISFVEGIEYGVTYNLYTLISNGSANNDCFRKNVVPLKVTFYPNPILEISLADSEYCLGQMIKINSLDGSSTIAKSLKDNSNVYWEFSNTDAPFNDPESESPFLYLDPMLFENGKMYSLNGLLTYEYDEFGIHKCSTEQQVDITISLKTAPNPKKIYWWPGDILTSEEDSTMCFQWGVNGSDLPDKNDPFLFTTTDGNDPSKFVDTNGDLITPFVDTFYVKTFEKTGNECLENPVCFTQVFFDEEQFNSRSVAKKLDFKLVPNPAHNQFYLGAISAPIGAKFNVAIFDMSGKLFLDIDKIYQGAQMEFDISNISNGIYIVRLIDEDGNAINKKLVIH